MSNPSIDPLTGLPIEDDEIAALSQLAQTQIELEDVIADLEAKLKDKKQQHTRISTEIIPQKLEELGLSEIKTLNGRKVTIKTFFSTRIISNDAFRWLDDEGHGGVIKTTVAKDFSRAEREEALAFAEENADKGFQFKESVHFQTLAALTRELENSGVELPADKFNVFKGKKTVIK